MYDAECSICLLDVSAHCWHVQFTLCVCAKKGGSEFGEIGCSKAAWSELCLRLNSDDAILMQNASPEHS